MGDWPEWVCPTHHAVLTSRGDALVCPEGESFPIRNGIPRFVSKEQADYAASFGSQWLKYRLTQLDSYSRTTITRDRTRRCVGEDLWASLEGKHVLECGCGAGRFTEILLGRGAKVTSVDLSEAVEANQQTFPQDEAHRIAQADIMRLPFAPQQFDAVFCLGVIQHTPNPEETIAALYEHVRPGGTLVIDHYTYYLTRFLKAAPLIRLVFRRLSPERGMRWTERLVAFFWPYHRMTRKCRLARMVLGRFSPVQCYYRAYPELSEELQWEWALLDTHDSLTDWYKHYRTRGQILRTLRKLGLHEIRCEYGGNGVEARGKRPL